MTFFRYPGGKTKLRMQIIKRLNRLLENDFEYREPFLGGGSIGTELLLNSSKVGTVWLNDKDFALSCLWTSVIRHPNDLIEKIAAFAPSIESFDQFKQRLLLPPPAACNDLDVVAYGFEKLAIHQMSFSGLGTKSGGPLGGRYPSAESLIGCRWSRNKMIRHVRMLHEIFKFHPIRGGCCTSVDFAEVIDDTSSNAVLYLDPPYFDKGSELYQHGFTALDHERLAYSLERTKHRWLLSYDDCDEIRNLYGWATVEKVRNVPYTINAPKNDSSCEPTALRKTELLISNPNQPTFAGLFESTEPQKPIWEYCDAA